MSRMPKNFTGALVALCAIALAPCAAAGEPPLIINLPTVHAGPAVGGERPLGVEWVPIDPGRLAEMRGGFLLPSGLVLSFGIERAVYVNGELTANTSLHIADISKLSADEAKAIARFNEGLVVQIGEGNHFDPVSLPGGVVIQNTLNDQHIVTMTQMEVSSGALQSFQDLNTSGALQDGLIGAIGTR